MIALPKRAVPRAPGGARVTARELVGLDFIAVAQPVSTSAYQRLLGMSKAVARRSLRKLRDLGLVTVHVVSMEQASRYTLAPAARPVLARALGRSPEDFHVPRGIGKTNLDHHDGVVDVYVALMVAVARSKNVALIEFLFEEQIRESIGTARGAQVPDAVSVMCHGETRFAIAWEIDRSTENPQWFATHKGLPYQDLQRSKTPLRGCATWRVCCTTPSERRRNKLLAALWDTGVSEGLWYFTAPGELDDRTILTSAWVTARLAPGGQQARLVVESPFEAVIADCDIGVHGQPDKIAGDAASLANHRERE